MNDGEFCGVFSVGSVFQYILRTGGKGIKPETTVAELGRHIQVDAHMENYDFVPKDATYLSVRRKFEKVRGKNKRISVILLRKTASPASGSWGCSPPGTCWANPIDG